MCAHAAPPTDASATAATSCSHSYCNRSNTTRKLKTPGGKLVLQYTAKKAKGPQTPVGDQGRIHGVRAQRHGCSDMRTLREPPPRGARHGPGATNPKPQRAAPIARRLPRR